MEKRLMSSVADAIMKRVNAPGRSRWVCTPKDFLDLGNREAVDQALSRLVYVRIPRVAKQYFTPTASP